MSCTPAYFEPPISPAWHINFLIHMFISKDNLTNLSLTTPNFIRAYMQKLGNLWVQICGCTRQGLKVLPCSAVYRRDVMHSLDTTSVRPVVVS